MLRGSEKCVVRPTITVGHHGHKVEDSQVSAPQSPPRQCAGCSDLTERCMQSVLRRSEECVVRPTITVDGHGHEVGHSQVSAPQLPPRQCAGCIDLTNRPKGAKDDGQTRLGGRQPRLTARKRWTTCHE